MTQTNSDTVRASFAAYLAQDQQTAERLLADDLVFTSPQDDHSEFVAAAQAAPDELTTIANIMAAPPLPFVAQEQRGQLVIMATVCYAGDPRHADRVLAPLRAVATPIADMVRPMPYPEIYPPDHGGERPWP